jgi:hypothetical protein
MDNNSAIWTPYLNPTYCSTADTILESILAQWTPYLNRSAMWTSYVQYLKQFSIVDTILESNSAMWTSYFKTI